MPATCPPGNRAAENIGFIACCQLEKKLQELSRSNYFQP
jgi:hypothetical protein